MLSVYSKGPHQHDTYYEENPRWFRHLQSRGGRRRAGPARGSLVPPRRPLTASRGRYDLRSESRDQAHSACPISASPSRWLGFTSWSAPAYELAFTSRLCRINRLIAAASVASHPATQLMQCTVADPCIRARNRRSVTMANIVPHLGRCSVGQWGSVISIVPSDLLDPCQPPTTLRRASCRCRLLVVLTGRITGGTRQSTPRAPNCASSAADHGHLIPPRILAMPAPGSSVSATIATR